MNLHEFLELGLELEGGDVIETQNSDVWMLNSVDAHLYNVPVKSDRNCRVIKSAELDIYNKQRKNIMQSLKPTQAQALQEAILKGQIAQSELVKYKEKTTKELEQKKTELDLILESLKVLAKPAVEKVECIEGEPKYIEGECYKLVRKHGTRTYYSQYIGGRFWCANFGDDFMCIDQAECNYTITHMVEDKQ